MAIKTPPHDAFSRAVVRFLGPELSGKASGYSLHARVGVPSRLMVHFDVNVDQLLATDAEPEPPRQRCTAQYGGRGDGERIVECDLLAGHGGMHYDASTETNWTEERKSDNG